MTYLVRPLNIAIFFGSIVTLALTASGQFVEVTSTVGLSPTLKKTWGNPVWADMNNDGYLDLIVPTHGLAASHGPFVYLSKSGTQFVDDLTNSKIAQAPTLDTRDWHGYSFADYDGDGNIDLYVAEGAKGSVGGTIKQDLLFRGNGDGTFTNVSQAAGIEVSDHRGRGSVFFDYNNDGKLDLFVKNYDGANTLYQNNGDSTFTIVADAAGLALATSGTDFGSIIAIADYDNDGFVDMAITGDGDVQALYRNVGGTFVDVTSTAGFVSQPNGQGMAWGDYNNDGFVDLFIARGHQGGPSTNGTLYRNNGDGTFTNVTAEAGVALPGNSWAGVWGDYDNDGYLDLFVTNAGTTGQGIGNANRLFHNNGNGTFTDVAVAQGVAAQDDTSLHKTAAWADYDNDGFLDLIFKDGIGGEEDNGASASGPHRLFHNTPNGNHFIKLKLQGVVSNRNGIGARVTMTTDTGLTCYRQNTGDAGGQYFSQSNLPLHFGIGQAAEATISIVWPSQVTDTITHVASNTTLIVVEGGAPPPTPTPTPTPVPPTITKQPPNRTVTVGKVAKFSVAATGDAPLSYQWMKNGIPITGATSPTYAAPRATLADDGSLFSVTVRNLGGNVTSRSARLKVNPALKPSPESSLLRLSGYRLDSHLAIAP